MIYAIEAGATAHPTLYGPFKSASAADSWARKNLTCLWKIVPLKEP